MTLRRVVGALVVAVVPLLAACGGSSGDTSPTRSAATSGPITQAQADRLAIARFNLYRGTGARITASLVSDGQPVRITADADFRRHLGYGTVGNGSSAVIVQWNLRTLAVWPGTVTATTAPAQLPATRPTTRALVTSNRVDVVLRLILNLGYDRPDNSLLLRRNGAEFLRTATIDGVAVDVLRGPKAAGSTTPALNNYWVDARGNLLRFEAQLGGGADLTPIDFAPKSYRTFALAPGLTAG